MSGKWYGNKKNNKLKNKAIIKIRKKTAVTEVRGGKENVQ